MKIYLASSFDLIDLVDFIALALRAHGFEVPYEWWHKDFKEVEKDLDDRLWYQLPEIIAISQRNFMAIDHADALVLVAPVLQSKKFNGANIELGYALAKGKKVYSIGLLERSGMYQPVRKCAGIDGLVRALKEAST